MIQLTDAEVAMYADVEETSPHRREDLALAKRYDAIWEHSRSSEMRSRRQEIADVCLRVARISAGRDDRYRVSMWRRRAWLHRHGRHGEVYDGTDAVKWQQAMRRAGAA
jgi:hypothetical protein